MLYTPETIQTQHAGANGELLGAMRREMFPNIRPGLLRVEQRIRFGGVLLRLHQEPALVSGVRKQLCFHHHMGTVVQTAEETDRMMANTDPRYMFLCYDTGHFTFAGEDPLAMLKKYVDRIGHVHLKDMRLSVVEAQQAPLPLIHHVLVIAGKHRRIHLPLNGIALLADVDPVSAHGSQEFQLPDKIRLYFLVRLGNQEGGEPPAGDPHPPQHLTSG